DGEWDALRNMFLDVGSDNPFLPWGEPASDLRLAAGYPAIKTHQFKHEQDAERIKIEPIYRCSIFDHALELEGCMPQRYMLEKQPGSESYVRDAQLRMNRELRRVEVEIHEACAPAWPVPFVVFVAGWYKCEFPCEGPERRSRQPFDECLRRSARPSRTL